MQIRPAFFLRVKLPLQQGGEFVYAHLKLGECFKLFARPIAPFSRADTAAIALA